MRPSDKLEWYICGKEPPVSWLYNLQLFIIIHNTYINYFITNVNRKSVQLQFNHNNLGWLFPNQCSGLACSWGGHIQIMSLQTYKAFNIAAFIAFLAFLTQLIVVGAVHSGVCDGDIYEWNINIYHWVDTVTLQLMMMPSWSLVFRPEW